MTVQGMTELIIVSFLFLTQYSLSSWSRWDYDHMTDWADDYAMCGAQDESPINIQTSQTINAEYICDPFFNWTIDFTKTTFKIANNGHAVSLKAAEATTIDPDLELYSSLITAEGETYITLGLNENTIATFPNYFKPKGSEHDTFCLDSLHFHWGTNDWTGSEHLINDYQYPLEAHFVHYSCEHASLGDTLEGFKTGDDVLEKLENGEDTHQLAFVSIFFEVVDDRTNPAFDRMFDGLHLYHIKYPNDILGIQTAEIVESLNLNDLIPDDIKTAGYYAYEGSLTTPPCTDIVRWFVMNAKGYIGRSQLAKFRELMSTINHTIAPNFRAPQENVNPVYSCMEPETTTTTTSTTESINSLFIIGIISCVLLSLILIVCTLMYLKGYRNNQKNDKPEEKPPVTVPSANVVAQNNQKNDNVPSPNYVDAKNTEIATLPKLPSDQKSNALTVPGMAEGANLSTNDNQQILKMIETYIELQKKESGLSDGTYENPHKVKFDENDNMRLEGAKSVSLRI